MRTLISFVLGTAIFGAVAAAAPAQDGASAAQARTEGDFAAWLHRRGEQFAIPYPLINTIIVSKDPDYRSGGTAWPGMLTPFIAGNDFALIEYMDMIAADRKQYGRINPFDRRLLADIETYDLPRKRAATERFEKLARALKIEAGPGPTGVDALAASAASSTKTRYNVESGLHERYDEARARWVPEKPVPPGL